MLNKNGIKQNMTTFVLVVFLALFICTYIILQSSWAFFRETESVFGNIQFGSVDVEWIGKYQSDTQPIEELEFQEGHYLLGTDINFLKEIYILNNGENDMYVRVLVSVIYNNSDYTPHFTFEGITINPATSSAWTFDGTNHIYYYNQKLAATEEIQFFTKFKANASGAYVFPGVLYNKNLTINFTAEAIQTSSEAYKTWQPAVPSSWENLIS